ncbi:hypothetical protein SK128_024665, partial [Halocaridina rubra]
LQQLVVNGELPCSKEEAASLACIQLRIEETWAPPDPPSSAQTLAPSSTHGGPTFTPAHTPTHTFSPHPTQTGSSCLSAALPASDQQHSFSFSVANSHSIPSHLSAGTGGGHHTHSLAPSSSTHPILTTPTANHGGYLTTTTTHSQQNGKVSVVLEKAADEDFFFF